MGTGQLVVGGHVDLQGLDIVGVATTAVGRSAHHRPRVRVLRWYFDWLDRAGMTLLTIDPDGRDAVDLDAVRFDEEMVERLRAGGPPSDPTDLLWVLLAAWRDDVRRVTALTG